MTRLSSHHRLVASVAAVVLLAAACGDDDDSSSATDPSTADTAEVTTDPVAETTQPSTDDTTPPATEAPTTEAPTTEAPTTEAPTTEPAAMFEGDLTGTFSVDDAVCVDAADVGGSYFRMLQPGGTLEDGPYIENFDSVCTDPTFSGLSAGTDGGLITGDWQPAPDPAYDDAGNALAAAVFQPVLFFAVDFGGATDPEEAVPMMTATGGVLSADLAAFTAYYGGDSFNQGAPKPDGSGDAPTGTIDPETGAYVLDWTSQITGGGFNEFVGVWHLEGTFTAAS